MNNFKNVIVTLFAVIASLSIQDYDAKFHLITIHYYDRKDDLVLVPKKASIDDIDKVIEQIRHSHEQRR